MTNLWLVVIRNIYNGLVISVKVRPDFVMNRPPAGRLETNVEYCHEKSLLLVVKRVPIKQNQHWKKNSNVKKMKQNRTMAEGG